MMVTLCSGDYEIRVNSMGAELKSFRRKDGMEFIWNSDPKFWMRSSPLLFPTIGNVRDNKTMFHGTEYPMPKHGFCKDTEFTLLSRTDCSATFALKASQQTLTYYPFLFELHLTYELLNNKLCMTYHVYNKDTKELPYHIGAHPGFMCPLVTNESLTDYQLEFEKEEQLEATLYDLESLCFSSNRKQCFSKEKERLLSLNVNMFDNDAVFFPYTNSRSVKLVHAVTGNGIQVDYPDFHSIAFWTPAGGNAPFLCIEPWNGAAIYDDEDNEFCHKRDLELLPPGSHKTYHLEISLIGF